MSFDSAKYLREQKIIQLTRYLERIMLEKYNIGLGCFGIPIGAIPTFTRWDFYENALDRNEITKEQYNEARLYYGPTWQRDLIVIEFDEKRHKIPSVAEKDKIKQDHVQNKLGCMFIRIPEECRDNWNTILRDNGILI